jgi:hypothetical protein
VEEALYILGKNLLGRDVIDKISPVAKKFANGLGQIGQGMSTIGETLPPLPTVEFDKGKLRLLPNNNYNNNNNLKEAPNNNNNNNLGQRDERHTGPVRAENVSGKFRSVYILIILQILHILHILQICPHLTHLTNFALLTHLTHLTRLDFEFLHLLLAYQAFY